MKISDKRLKERVKDIMNGAGAAWVEDNACFEYTESAMRSYYLAVPALARAFGIMQEPLHKPWVAPAFDDLGELVKLVRISIEHEATVSSDD